MNISDSLLGLDERIDRALRRPPCVRCGLAPSCDVSDGLAEDARGPAHYCIPCAAAVGLTDVLLPAQRERLRRLKGLDVGRLVRFRLNCPSGRRHGELGRRVYVVRAQEDDGRLRLEAIDGQGARWTHPAFPEDMVVVG
jgi:hypothetical protein